MKHSTQTLNPDSIEPWQWTAFALGELDSETMEQMRQLVSQNPQLQEEQKHLTSFLHSVRSIVAKHASDQETHSEHVLLPEQSQSIKAVIQQSTPSAVVLPSKNYLRNRRRLIALLSTAAAIPIGYLGYQYLQTQNPAARFLALHSINGSSSQLSNSQKPSSLSTVEQKPVSPDSIEPETEEAGKINLNTFPANRLEDLDGLADGASTTSDTRESKDLYEQQNQAKGAQKNERFSIADNDTEWIPLSTSPLSPALVPNDSAAEGMVVQHALDFDTDDKLAKKLEDTSLAAGYPDGEAGPPSGYSGGSGGPAGPSKQKGGGANPYGGFGSMAAKDASGAASGGSGGAGFAANGLSGPGGGYSGGGYGGRAGGVPPSSKSDANGDSIAAGVSGNTATTGPQFTSDLDIKLSQGSYGVAPPFGNPSHRVNGAQPLSRENAGLDEYRVATVESQQEKELASLMMTVTPNVDIPVEAGKGVAGRGFRSINPSTKPEGRTSDFAERQGLPEELKQNVPHLFGDQRVSGDRFEPVYETPFARTSEAQLSTFSIDVDTASYSKVRQYLMQANALPNPNMVRIEEMLNYFDYSYPVPNNEDPFAADMAVANCPWNHDHQLVRIGLQAKKIQNEERPSANLVFLIDVSGSMNEPNKLPLVKRTLSMLVEQLQNHDRVAIVVYAGAAGCVLPSTLGTRKQAILDSIDHLHAGGSTNGGQGIQLAYNIAREQFIPGGINRVILCTDGDFNVGVTNNEELIRLMQENAKSKVFFTCLGYGIGNYNDAMMEQISDKGNGVYGMIDSDQEARKTMVEQLSGTLMTVAKDVKIQVEFNPARVAGYRLIGYENRRLANKDFSDDRKDAGEVGAGHRVTALYEVVPTGSVVTNDFTNNTDELRYRKQREPDANKALAERSSDTENEWLTLKLRYKHPEGDVSTKREFILNDRNSQIDRNDRDLQWVTSIAEFGLLLRNSRYAPQADWSQLLERAESAAGDDARRRECVEMMQRARVLAGNR